jgi:hypothetical protein
MKMEATCFFETSIDYRLSILRYIHRCESLHFYFFFSHLFFRSFFLSETFRRGLLEEKGKKIIITFYL